MIYKAWITNTSIEVEKGTGAFGMNKQKTHGLWGVQALAAFGFVVTSRAQAC
jgi:hypothetical protein